MLRTPQARGKEAEDLACDAGLPMISETLTAMRTHHNSIHRYRRLLEVAGLSANMSKRVCPRSVVRWTRSSPRCFLWFSRSLADLPPKWFGGVVHQGPQTTRSDSV